MKNRGEMDAAFYERVVGEMVDAGVEELGLFYIGESFMCDWLPEAIAFAKKRGIRYAFLTTNGSLATPERVRACMKAGLDSLKFSMNNADEEQFVADRGGEGEALPRRDREPQGRARGARRRRLQVRALRFEHPYDGEQQVQMQALVDEHPALSSTSTTGCRSTRWAAVPPSARRSWATGRSPATRVASARCASRCRAGRHSPRATSRTTASSRRAASTRATSG